MIQCQIAGRVRKSNGVNVDIPLTAEFVYDPDTDPLAVLMAIKPEDQDEIIWTIGRELLVAGSTSIVPYGCGDVRFQYLGPGSSDLLVCLKPPGGHADIVFKQAAVIYFLNRTMDAVKLGEEDLHGAVGNALDEELEDILG